MKVVLIPCASTEWDQEGRLLGRTEVPPTPAGENACLDWAQTLERLGIAQIHHGPDELATRTAQLLARKLLVPTKSARNLAEVDAGLWTGLTEDDLESRYASAHRELRESPLNVSPPGGESLGKADARVKTFLNKQLRRNGEAVFGLVARPVALAMARCALEERDVSTVWETARQTREPVVVDVPDAKRAALAEALVSERS